MTTLAVLAVAWALPIWQQLTQRPGNLSEMARYFGSHRGSAQSIRHVVSAVVALAAGLHDHLGVDAGPAAPLITGLHATWLDGAMVVVGVALPAAAAKWGPERTRRAFGAWALVVMVALAAAVLSGRSIDGDPYLYLLACVSGLAICLQAGALAALVVLVRAQLPASVPPRAAAKVGVVGLATIALVAAGVGAVRAADVTSFAALMHNADVAAILPAATATLDDAGVHVVHVAIADDATWPIAAGLVNGLEHAGFGVTVDDGWVFMFGHDHRSHVGEPVLTVDRAPGGEPPPGTRVVEQTGAIVVSFTPA